MRTEQFRELRTRFAVVASFFEGFSNFPFGLYDYDGYRRMTDAVSRDTTHSWSSKSCAPLLDHTPRAARSNHERIRSIESNKALDSVCDSTSHKFDNHREFYLDGWLCSCSERSS